MIGLGSDKNNLFAQFYLEFMYYCDDLPKVLMFGNFILERASITSLQLFFFGYCQTLSKRLGKYGVTKIDCVYQ